MPENVPSKKYWAKKVMTQKSKVKNNVGPKKFGVQQILSPTNFG